MRPVGVVARGWGWRHGGRREWAVRDLDLTVEPGERILLLGPSGGGKSTLLAALAGVLTGDESGEQRGTLEVGGRPPAPGLAGLVLQDPETQVILPRLADDVAFGAENLGVPPAEIAERTARSLELVGLAQAPDHPTSALSGGQKQRLALAGVLTMRPGLLLLDEPTANLDPQGAAAVRDAVAAAAASTGATLVVVEHRVDRWLPVVDRVVVLGPAGLLADGDPAGVLAGEGAALAAAGVWVPGREPEPPVLPAAGAPALLRTRGLGVGRDEIVLRLADRDVGAAGALLVAGPNGAGKTTALLTLGGLIPPLEGAVVAAPPLAAGLSPYPFRWRARDLPARIASVLQSPQHQFVASTVRREVALGLPATAAGRARADAVLERIGLASLAEANPFTLSVGQQRRLTVGAALAARPRLLLLDEPTFGQDARTWAALADLLVEALADGVGIVAATHDERLLAGASDVLRVGKPRVAA